MTPDEITTELREIMKIAWYGCASKHCEFNEIRTREKTDAICECRETMKRRLKELEEGI
jgi:hypothetical protein